PPLDPPLTYPVRAAHIPDRRAGGRAPVGPAHDDPAAVQRRLAAYRAQTAPVLDWYEARGGVRRIPATGTVPDIAEAVRQIVGG
ncbi:MAG: hypothetical protein KJZ47_03255, partial [Gemmatimonadales bacterium]|nr:hypothetical protein [Gemmatimonadales bacterium]